MSSNGRNQPRDTRIQQGRPGVWGTLTMKTPLAWAIVISRPPSRAVRDGDLRGGNADAAYPLCGHRSGPYDGRLVRRRPLGDPAQSAHPAGTRGRVSVRRLATCGRGADSQVIATAVRARAA